MQAVGLGSWSEDADCFRVSVPYSTTAPSAISVCQDHRHIACVEGGGVCDISGRTGVKKVGNCRCKFAAGQTIHKGFRNPGWIRCAQSTPHSVAPCNRSELWNLSESEGQSRSRSSLGAPPDQIAMNARPKGTHTINQYNI